MFFGVVGHSDDIDVEGVLAELTEQCGEALGGRSPKAGILFSTIDMEHGIILEGIDHA